MPLTARGWLEASPLGWQREAARRRSPLPAPSPPDAARLPHLPAQVLLLMESMIDAGVHFGFPRAVATKLTLTLALALTVALALALALALTLTRWRPSSCSRQSRARLSTPCRPRWARLTPTSPNLGFEPEPYS